MVTAIKGTSILIVFLVIGVPLLLKPFRPQPTIATPICPADQTPFAIQVDPDSYVDIIPVETIGYGIIPILVWEISR